MIVPKIKFEGEKMFSTIESKLDLLPPNKIAHANWTDNEKYPDVTFKIAHDGNEIFLQFKVKEDEVRAVAQGNHSKVWQDSCVEFFVSFDDSGYYYNLEQSCIGQALFGYRKERPNPTYASDEVMAAIKRLPSLGGYNFELKQGDFEWTILSVIPSSSFWNNNIKTLDGLKAKANFYKCGDNLTNPHYLSWAPVNVEQPDFHRVDFFREITFED